ncbi:hypothetical protein Gotur_018663 [Gossypium turneri]
MEHETISLLWNVNLDKLLVSQVMINGILQRVEYEYFSTICFSCELYEHVKEICSNMEPCPRENSGVPPVGGESLTVDTVMVNDDRVKETCAYKPWMLFERKLRLPLGEKGKGVKSEDSSKASIKGKGVTDGDRVSGYQDVRQLLSALLKSVNNMVELISSQIQKKGDTRGLKVVEKQLEVEDVISH